MKQVRLYLFCLLTVNFATGFITSGDFWGEWRINLQKSSFKNVPSIAAPIFYSVKKNNDLVNLTWIVVNNKNEKEEVSQVLSLDGVSHSAMTSTGRRRTTTLSVSDSGMVWFFKKSYSTVIDTSLTDYEILQKWSLSENGKELNIVLSTDKYSIKAVYDRQ